MIEAMTARRSGAAALLLAAACRPAPAAVRPPARHVHIDAPEVDLRRLPRPVRRRPAAARLQGLHRRSARAATASSACTSATSPQPGGPSFPEAAVKSLAATYQVDAAPNDAGQGRQAPGHPRRRHPRPVQERAGGPLRPERRAAARPLADRQGARRRRRARRSTVVPDMMLRDIASGYQEGGADYVYAYLTGYTDAAGRHEAGRLHELQRGLPRPPDGHGQPVRRRRRPRQVRRRHAADGRQLRPRRGGVPGLGRPTRRWRSASAWACW